MSTRSTDTNHFKQASDNIVQNENLDFSRANSLYSKEDMLSSENNQVGTHMISCALNPENEKEPVQTVDGYDIAIMADTGALKTLWIPELPEGRYFFQGENSDNYLVYLEAVDKKWIAKCHPKANFVVSNTQAEEIFRDGETRGEKGIIGEMLNRSSNMNHSSNYSRMSQHHYFLSSLEIRDHTFSPIEIGAHRRLLYVEASYTMDRVFHNYYVRQGASIRIGRKQDNDIICQNPYISKHHAVIHWDGNEFLLRDENSSNGTYVNGRQEQNKVLQTGDLIYIMGLKIVVGPGLLSINSGNGRTYISDSSLREINDEALRNLGRNNQGASLKSESNLSGGNYFNRTPRKKKSEINKTISIESPPMSLNGDHIPLLLRMGGSMVMSGASMLSGNYLSMVSMVLFPVLNQKYTEKQKKEYEQRRRIKYQEYLKNKEEEIIAEIKSEEDELNHFFPPTDTVILYPREGRRLWERLRTDNDFLQIRIGSGRLPLIAKIEYSEKRFSLDEDDLEDSMYELAQRRRYIDNVPIILPLVENYVCGVVGSRVLKLEFVRHVISQIAFLHGYDEVKLIFLLDKEDYDAMPFIRTLPHVWNDDRSFRYLATDYTSVNLLAHQLTEAIGNDLTQPRSLNKILRDRPYYILLSFSEKLYSGTDFIKDILSNDQNVGVSIMTFFDKAPKEVQSLISLSQHGNNLISFLSNPDKEDCRFSMDHLDSKSAFEMFHLISNTRLNVINQSYVLPKMMTFLEMFGVGKVEHLNPIKRWAENNPIYSLAAPVGVTEEGDPFILDLHEKAHGPHGLVAGMTGSGKSEFLITYILSLAINYHPDEVAFVLIDYKGGGLAGAFEDPSRGIHLPHLVGTITNLDGSAIQRSLMSIESELKRRQRLFNEAKSVANEGTMDIYSYQKLRRKGIVSEPLPHLFIISDEFAELKSQEPEFMDQLISTARIGRSLGVHLILATQKPAGVVNDQINSNSKFRVCLKVQTRADSVEMLQRADAAAIKETGRFYLLVGYDEYFALGQSAWCGAPYAPQEEVITHRDDAIQFLDDLGQSRYQVAPTSSVHTSDTSQLVAIVKYLSALAENEGIGNRKLWMDPLPGSISIEDAQMQQTDSMQAVLNPSLCTPEKGSPKIAVTVGVIDDPENQARIPLVLNFSKNRNLMIIGSVRSGKSTALETILFLITNAFSPEDINYYILDYSGKMLTIFNGTPYCGGFWGEGDEKDVEKFFELLREIIAERKECFLKESVNSFEAYCLIKKIPLIFVIIDNINGLSSWKRGESIYYDLNTIIRDANAVGIRFIITATSADDVMFRIKKEFDLRLALCAKNRYEYGDILDARCRFEPALLPGRGMCRADEDRTLEIQLFHHIAGNSEQDRIRELRTFLLQRSEFYKDCTPPKRLPSIRTDESYEEFCKDIPYGRIPLGYDTLDVKKVAMPFRQLFCMSLFFGNIEGRIPLMRNYLYAAIREKMSLLIVRRKDDSIFETEEIKNLLKTSSEDIKIIISSEEGSEKLRERLTNEIISRKEYRNIYCQKHGLLVTAPDTMEKCRDYIRDNTSPFFVIFEDLVEFAKLASDLCGQALQQIMKNGKGYNFYFLSCFYPTENTYAARNDMVASFNPDQFIMLYGGQFNKQGLITLPLELSRTEKKSKNYNACLMHYRGEFYPLITPCGDIAGRKNDPDDESII